MYYDLHESGNASQTCFLSCCSPAPPTNVTISTSSPSSSGHIVFCRSDRPTIQLDRDLLRRELEHGDELANVVPSVSCFFSPLTFTTIASSLCSRGLGRDSVSCGFKRKRRAARRYTSACPLKLRLVRERHQLAHRRMSISTTRRRHKAAAASTRRRGKRNPQEADVVDD